MLLSCRPLQLNSLSIAACTKKRADVEFTNEFSAHAKANELIGFLKKFKNPRLILVNHGSDESKTIFADCVVKEINCSDVGILGKCYILIKNMSI